MSEQKVSFIACLGSDDDHGPINPSVIAWLGEVPYNPPGPDGQRSIAICDAFAVFDSFEAAMNTALNEFETQYRAEMRKQYEFYQSVDESYRLAGHTWFSLNSR